MLIVPTFLSSQTLMNHKGTYSFGDYMGTANYYYYENDDHERIYHGAFKFKENHEYAGFDLEVVGNFKDNKRDGLWKIIKKDSYNNTETIMAHYSNGKLNGRASLVSVDSKGNRVASSTVNFSSNKIIGKFLFECKKGGLCNQQGDIRISIEFNSVGELDGDYLVTFRYNTGHYEDRRKYKGGILLYKLYRDISSGDIVCRHDDNSPEKSIDNSDNSQKSDYSSIVSDGCSGYGNMWDVYIAIQYWLKFTDDQYSGKNILYTDARGIDFDGFGSYVDIMGH